MKNKGLTKSEKLKMSYAVKSDPHSNYKEVDDSRRTVDVIANTYNYFDTDMDVLVPGCCAKSIEERGPKSELPGKIKHLSNHDLHKGIGRPDLIEETTMNGVPVLHAQSWMSETTEGEETLIKYKEGLIDQHSIGFRYLQLEWVEGDSREFDNMVKDLINPDEAVDAGMMWVVKEIQLFEYSSLDGFGSNRLTPFLGVKSANKTIQYNNLVSKLDALHAAMRSGVKDKYLLELQENQIKQMIFELYNQQEPSLKETHQRSSGKGTQVDVENYLQTHKILN